MISSGLFGICVIRILWVRISLLRLCAKYEESGFVSQQVMFF